MRSRFTVFSALLATGALLFALVGCSAPEAVPAPEPTTAPSTPTETPTPVVTVPTSTSSVAEASVDVVTAFDTPNGTAAWEFANPIESGAPLTFYVEEREGDWLHVRLPTRPNGTTGWIRASDVSVKALHYSLHVSTAGHTVTLLKNDEIVQTFPAAVGTGDTPTPLGEFYLTELLAPTNAGYGPYAYGISAFSEVLNEFGGGPGQIGMHGTEDASSIGRSASHGCIRLSNEDITTLAGLLPLGTPITIE